MQKVNENIYTGRTSIDRACFVFVTEAVLLLEQINVVVVVVMHVCAILKCLAKGVFVA